MKNEIDSSEHSANMTRINDDEGVCAGDGGRSDWISFKVGGGDYVKISRDRIKFSI